MALHELTTNAVKYGALGQKNGRLNIRWRVQTGERRVALDRCRLEGKRRRDRSIRKGPRGVGNGRRLIEDALPYQFGARTTFAIEPDGVHCTIALPLSGPQTEEIQDGRFGAS